MYDLIRKLLFLRDAERAHDSAVVLLERLQSNSSRRALLRLMAGTRPSVPRRAMGLAFAHPLGVAAGFDKDARVVLALQELGFSFVEIGTVTPRPQPGNPRPRMWRFPEAQALVNALGFPGEGMVCVGARLRALREGGRLAIPVGVNLGKNAETPLESAAGDYVAVFEHLHELGDYFVVNVSSPNTPGLRDMQSIERLRPLLSELMERNTRLGAKPLLVKIAPDLADEDIAAVGRLTADLGLGGVVSGNTTVRRELVPRAAMLDRGGLSGEPLFPRTAVVLRLLRSELKSDQCLIAAGGISNAARLKEALAIGADLVQVYTSFIYRGPRCVHSLLAHPA